jgi:hypothetical protein
MGDMARSIAGYRGVPFEAMVIDDRYCVRKRELWVGSIGNMRG